MNEPPLTDRELRIVRGMLDEYEYNRRRRQQWFGELRISERLLLIVFAAAPTIDVILRIAG